MEAAIGVTGFVGFLLAFGGGLLFVRNWLETRLSERALARRRGQRTTALLSTTVRMNRRMAPFLLRAFKVGLILIVLAVILAMFAPAFE